jgi:DTW domain-containing protein YfiP
MPHVLFMRSRTDEFLVGRCLRCYANKKWCLCSKIPIVQTSFQIVIIRHLHESYKTSNTARMAHLALPNSMILDYLPETFDDSSLLTNDSAVLFPTTSNVWPEAKTPARLFVLDGTWHQASRMAKKIVTLRGVPGVSFANASITPKLRQPTEEHRRSTLEAIALAVEKFDGNSAAAPLFDLYLQMVSHLRAARGYPIVPDVLSE